MSDNKAAEYKLAKELFVSNHNGGTISEINLVAAVAPASVLLWSALQAKQSLFTPYTPLACLVDFLLNCAAILFATTLYSNSLVLLNALLLIPAALTPLGSSSEQRDKTRKKPTPNGAGHNDARDPLPIKPFVTTYRGTMMVITCAAILAVDFRVFPRRFAKVENWGTSLMDIGVGSFVFSAGTVAARPILKQQLANSSTGFGERLYTAGRHALPLLVLGLIRLYSVKGLDYAEHVTEYGVHWNFFFTLGLLPPFVAVFDSIIYKILPSYAILAILLGIIYQVVLDFTHLQSFILIAPRTDLLSKNREGIFSFVGYLAIFLSGQATGMYILPRSNATNSPRGLAQNPVLRKLALWSAAWSALFFLCTDYRLGAGIQVSRRLANLPYILWIAAFNSVQILLFALIETFLFPDIYSASSSSRAVEVRRASEASSRLLRAFNRNGLAVFLLANLLTGLVNLTVRTLEMGDAGAMGTLVGYLGVLSAVALALDAWDVSVKL